MAWHRVSLKPNGKTTLQVLTQGHYNRAMEFKWSIAFEWQHHIALFILPSCVTWWWSLWDWEVVTRVMYWSYSRERAGFGSSFYQCMKTFSPAWCLIHSSLTLSKDTCGDCCFLTATGLWTHNPQYTATWHHQASKNELQHRSLAGWPPISQIQTMWDVCMDGSVHLPVTRNSRTWEWQGCIQPHSREFGVKMSCKSDKWLILL